MPKGYPIRFCRGCDQSSEEVGRLSATKLCAECGDARLMCNNEDLRSHSGPFFDYWRYRSLAALGVFVPLDDSTERG